MALRILLDAGGSLVRYRTAGETPSDVLAVTFTGFEGSRNNAPGFAESMLAEAGIDCVAVKMHRKGNFQDISLEDFRQAVGPVVRRYRRVVTYGASGGAYGAIYFASAVGADVALALSPRNTRDPRHARNRDRGAMRKSFRHKRLAEVADGQTRLLVISDLAEEIDRRYLEAEIAPLANRTVISFPFGGHPVSRVLAETGSLKPMLLSVLRAHDADAAEIAAREAVSRARRDRRKSGLFVAFILSELARRGRMTAFSRIAGILRPDKLDMRQLFELRHAYALIGREAVLTDALEAALPGRGAGDDLFEAHQLFLAAWRGPVGRLLHAAGQMPPERRPWISRILPAAWWTVAANAYRGWVASSNRFRTACDAARKAVSRHRKASEQRGSLDHPMPENIADFPELDRALRARLRKLTRKARRRSGKKRRPRKAGRPPDTR